jgi:hypothetical protein
MVVESILLVYCMKLKKLSEQTLVLKFSAAPNFWLEQWMAPKVDIS